MITANLVSMPRVMGVLNVTPDSFSDGGRFSSLDAAVDCALRMIDDGVALIDVGGESTRPGAGPVSVADEIARVVPLIEAVRATSDIPISVDTSKPQVMLAAVEAGATMINDVRALQQEGALATAAQLGVDVCLMHMRGQPGMMQNAPVYDDVLDDVYAFLARRVDACLQAGIPRNKLIIDPGFGFGKTLTHNLVLFKNLKHFKSMALPLLVGLSRKSMLGAITGRSANERLAASIAGAVLAVKQGADIVRVHDVAETVDALKICYAIQTLKID